MIGARLERREAAIAVAASLIGPGFWIAFAPGSVPGLTLPM
jgi:hypothetical protein